MSEKQKRRFNRKSELKDSLEGLPQGLDHGADVVVDDGGVHVDEGRHLLEREHSVGGVFL